MVVALVPRADDGFGLDQEAPFSVFHERGAEQTSHRTKIAQPSCKALGKGPELPHGREKRFGVDEVLPGRAGLQREFPNESKQGPDFFLDGSRGTRPEASDQHPVADPHGIRSAVARKLTPRQAKVFRVIACTVHGLELDLDQLGRPGQPGNRHQGEGGANLSEVARKSRSGGVEQSRVGNVEAGAGHVFEVAFSSPHTLPSQIHDGVHLDPDIALTRDVALAIDGGGTRLEHDVTQAQRSRIVGFRFQWTTGTHIDTTTRSCHGDPLLGQDPAAAASEDYPTVRRGCRETFRSEERSYEASLSSCSSLASVSS